MKTTALRVPTRPLTGSPGSSSGLPWRGRPAVRRVAALFVLGAVALVGTALQPALAQARVPAAGAHERRSAADAATVWLCRPGAPGDPCTASLRTSVVQASGATTIVDPKAATASKFDCFYMYPTVSPETTPNSDLRVQQAERYAAIAQASPFSTVCRVWAPMYRQVTLSGLSTQLLTVTSPAIVTAYGSFAASFEDYLAHYNDGRPIIFLAHSQGSAMLILLFERLVEQQPALQHRLVLAIIAGGNVAVRAGSLEGGSFSNIPLCKAMGEDGCVIAYSTFPNEPPAGAFFGRPGLGVSYLSGQPASSGLHVACVNPAALAGGGADLDPFFPTSGRVSTPWVEYPHLYSARCESAGGATWLQVTKVTGASDHRPVVTEQDGPDWGYHADDVNLALGNLVADAAAAEAAWEKR
jgi:DUF3089 family protein